MAKLKAVARKQKATSPFPVYIRVTHRRQAGYINTNKVISGKDIAPDGDLKDPIVNEYCSRLMLNRKNVDSFSLQEVIEFLTTENNLESFSEYAQLHCRRMEGRGQIRNAKNYKLAVAHLERYLGTTQITFAQLSSIVLNKWIEKLSKETNRAKEMYPVCVRQIFKAALVELNDEERGLIRIKFNP